MLGRRVIFWGILATFIPLLEGVVSVNPSGGLVSRLMSQKTHLIQDGLSFTNFTVTNPDHRASISLSSMKNMSDDHKVRCLIQVENWSRWLLSDPISYFKHGTFQSGFWSREVFPAHREVIIAGNAKEHSFTGTSGVMAWEIEKQNVHLLILWSIPYNLGFYNSYLGVGVVELKTTVEKDLLPYYYREMISKDRGSSFQRGKPGADLVYRHEKFFVVASLEDGYQPLLNVSVMPWSTKDLAPSIWHKLYLDSLKSEVKSRASARHCDTALVTLALCFAILSNRHLKSSSVSS